MSAADSPDTVTERSAEHDHVTVKHSQITERKFSIKRLSLRRAPSLPRKGSLEAAGFDLFFFSHQTPLLEGHVFKDGRGTMSGFAKRYFLLFEGVLIYYSHQSSYKRDQGNFLRNGTVYRLDNLYLSKVESPPPRAKHCFYLHVPHEANKRNTLLLATSNRKAKNIWMEMLQKQNPHLQPSHHSHDTTDGFKRVPSYIHKIREYHLGSPTHVTRGSSNDETDGGLEVAERHKDGVFSRNPSLPLHRV